MLKHALSSLAALILVAAAPACAAPDLGSLKQGQVVDGFRTEAVYTIGSDHAVGARFVHQRTGFVMDYLQMQSVPQAFVWVNSYPTSDNGEPHTQEHLLLGKGNQGRGMANLEAMSLTDTGAFTMQWRTCYHFNTRAGAPAFYQFLQHQIDALLRPDYTDEEIRREVRNFGVAQDARTHALRLGEQGTVYNEMVSTYTQPDTWAWYNAWRTIYGVGHPLAWESGGTPEGLRHLTPAAIRRFHDAHYLLNNMGMVACFPHSMTLDSVLTRTNGVLNALQPGAAPPAVRTVVPPAHGAPAGTIRIVDYGNRNVQQPETVMLAWPASRDLSTRDELVLSLFADNVSGNASTNLYKLFVDTRTRQMDTGATSVWSMVSSDKGHPVMLGLSGVPSQKLTATFLSDVRTLVSKELARIAAMPDGSPQLEDFNKRLLARIVERQRGLSKFVGTPPEFGFRGTGSDWMDHLLKLERSGQFHRSLTLQPELAYATTLASSKHNEWKGLLAQWHLLDTQPYAIAPHANPGLLAADAHALDVRLQTEVARLQKLYHTPDTQSTLKRYQSDYNTTSASLDKLARGVAYPPFVQSPPMTLDDDIDFKVETGPRQVPSATARFDDLSGTTMGVALRVDATRPEQRVLLSVLPTLLTQSGAIVDGQPMSYEVMQDRLRNEILDLSASFAVNGHTGRTEVEISAAGNDAAENRKALSWLNTVLTSPDWRRDNLPRLRDVVDQRLNELRNRREGAEESWVGAMGGAWLHQYDPYYLTAVSFLTQEHDAGRVRWMLTDVPADQLAPVQQFLEHLAAAAAGHSREDLQLLLTALQGGAGHAPDAMQGIADEAGHLPQESQALVRRAAEDLTSILAELPASTLETDWGAQCHQMNADLAIGPDKTLAALDGLRHDLLKTGQARTFIIGPGSQVDELRQSFRSTVDAALGDGGAPSVGDQRRLPLVTSRLQEHDPSATQPVFAAFVNPNSEAGIFLNSSPGMSYQQTDPSTLLRGLAFCMYGGHGAHSLYMKTWAAGLAYSNGLRNSTEQGRFNYYAERCPELPQTMSFVVDQIRQAPFSSTLADYAVAQVFPTRAAETFEERGEAMAADTADGLTPDVVRRFHGAVLTLRQRPDFARAVYDQLKPVVGTVLPGLSGHEKDVAGGSYLVIGNDHQCDLYDAWLKSVEGSGTILYRLYPRDFWLP